jgi:MEKHLA domain
MITTAAMPDPWAQPARRAELIRWTERLLDSYRHWTGRELVPRVHEPETDARTVFEAPFVVVSHGTQPDPILNYGNRAALRLWETDWATLITLPSRLTAEPVNRAERERMLAQAATRGYIDDYRGVRISTTGRRFLVEKALVWNVIDRDGAVHGQAATFAAWTFLDSSK